VGVRGITAAVDANFIDILNDTDSVIGLQGHFEARYGPWGGFLDGTWAMLGADGIPAGLTTLRVENELTLVELGALHRLGEWSLGRGGSDLMAEGEGWGEGWRSVSHTILHPRSLPVGAEVRDE
jgi:hypothetical protein